MSRQVIGPARRVEGELSVPGDKSISHRALMLAAVGLGPCEVANPSPAADVRATTRALAALGVRLTTSNSLVEGDEPSTSRLLIQILVDGQGFPPLIRPDAPLDCGNSGTTMRTLLGILAGRPFEATVDGDESLRRRPMRRVVEPLRRMGATIEGRDGGELAPLRVTGGTLVGAHHDLEIPSAQVKTALLYAGLQADGETSVSEPSPSRDHTERLLRYLRVPIASSSNRLIIKSTDIQNASSLDIPGDVSSAAFLLVAAAIVPGSHVRILDVGTNPTRTGILDVLRSFGASVSVSDERELCGEPRGTVEVRAADRRPVAVGRELFPRIEDELPLVAVLGAAAEGESLVSGAEELRVKESDRIATITAGLAAMGAEIEALPDGFRVRGGRPLHGAAVEGGGDHRIAMALAVAALVADGSSAVSGWDSVPVSYPGFADHLERLVVPR